MSLSVSNDLKSKVHYMAEDSITFDIENEKVYLYGKAHITYEDIILDAAYVEVDWITKMLFARGTTDSLGNAVGLPEFKQNEDKLEQKIRNILKMDSILQECVKSMVKFIISVQKDL